LLITRLKGENMSRYKVIFSPDRREINVEEGITLLEAADLAGIHINNLCGGQGVCGECKVRIRKGVVEKSTKSISLLSKDEIQQGYVTSKLRFPWKPALRESES
jgi:ferredoxin